MIDHTLLSKRMLFLVHFLRYPNLISIVRYEPSVALLSFHNRKEKCDTSNRPYYTFQRVVFFGTTPTVPKFDKYSEVSFKCCTSHIECSTSQYRSIASVIAFHVRNTKLEIDHTLLSKQCSFLVHFLRYPNLISIVRSEPSVGRLTTPLWKLLIIVMNCFQHCPTTSRSWYIFHG